MIAIGQTFSSLVAESFDQIRTSAAGNVALMLRMLGAVQTIGRVTDSPVRRRVLREQLDWVAELAERTIASPHDRGRLFRRKAAVLEGWDPQDAAFPCGDANDFAARAGLAQWAGALDQAHGSTTTRPGKLKCATPRVASA